jgi:hypothetical protein
MENVAKLEIVLAPEDFSDLALEKCAQRRKDHEDIAAGRRTPEQVQRDNCWLIPQPEKLKILNLVESCERL